MMARMTSKLIIAAALVATAGCAKKRPEVLPPAPGDQTPTPTPDQTTPTPTQTGVTPGSAEDFQRSVTSDTVHFALDESNVDSEARSILDSQIEWLTRYPNVQVTVEGHCDERGTREYNLALGDRRANAVANYLSARGIDSSRINTISYGKERPIAMGSNPEAWAQNRRAVTVVIG